MFAVWCLIIGALLIFIGISDTLRRQLPVSTSALYLVAGYALGPEGFGFIDLNLARHAGLLERVTETAVLISLFAVGLRLRMRLSDRIWRVPVMLATAAMLVTIGVVAGVGMALGLSLGAAVLLGAILAPTDPVLASDVQIKRVADRDRLRFALTGEGGLNDGMAFPFVMLALGLLGLHELGAWGWRWWSVDFVWAVFGGLALGWSLGLMVSKAVVYLRREREQALGMESFLTLGLIALTYGLALSAATYGFLAVFAAGLAMRHVEHDENPHKQPDQIKPAEPTDEGTAPAVATEEASAYMAKAVLDFALDLEKLAELAVMLLIGALVSRQSFTTQSVLVAATLIFVARPLAVYLTTLRLTLSTTQRRLVAWFGIRGIGSMYYLCYAIAHDARGEEIDLVADAALVAIVFSILLHGSSSTPVMNLYHKASQRRRGARIEAGPGDGG